MLTYTWKTENAFKKSFVRLAALVDVKNVVSEKLMPYFAKSTKTQKVWKVQYIYIYHLEGTHTVK